MGTVEAGTLGQDETLTELKQSPVILLGNSSKWNIEM
jgi:hypothetical protein